VRLGRELGFTFVTVDLAGFSSGSLNQLLGIRKKPQ
jgi:PP-loop superfamily ATP-utilizing enzyme